MCRAPPTTSESGKNASGQEAFGSKIQETPVVESPTILTADVTSTAGRAGTSTARVSEDEGGNLYTPAHCRCQTRMRS
jgi:hypothetical protein